MKSGIIAVHKPEGISSAAVVSRIKRLLKAKKAGHTGTLDPFATGLLLCAVNQATRISGYFLGGHKRYTAQLRLGIETDTHDLTGKIEYQAADDVMASLTKTAIKQAIVSFGGIQEQLAPSFSALKHNGQPLYKLARQGIKIQKPPRTIEIFSIDILSIELPHVNIEVYCSAGTYIRSLAFDIGKKLGCGAHLSKLCRTGSSQFDLDHAVGLEKIEAEGRDAAEELMIPLSECLPFLPGINVDDTVMQKIKYGQRVSEKDLHGKIPEPGQPLKLLDMDNALVAIVELDNDQHRINYSCVFAV
ncbi:MAG: tRNA pseudouridine(55) synthase TruB [Proteobacteria bacterium]|nr:tRNA pseudouridine(55) synthase TruB [Pseudomonadota bacterium]